MSTIDIRKIRTESGLSQKDFAKKIGVLENHPKLGEKRRYSGIGIHKGLCVA